MQIQIQSSFQIKGDLDRLIELQLNKLARFYNRIVYATVYLQKDPKALNDSIVKIQLGIPGPDLVVHEATDSFEKSLRLVINRLKRQIKSMKEKKKR